MSPDRFEVIVGATESCQGLVSVVGQLATARSRARRTTRESPSETCRRYHGVQPAVRPENASVVSSWSSASGTSRRCCVSPHR